MGLELRTGPLVGALPPDDLLVRFPVTPTTLAKDRDAFCLGPQCRRQTFVAGATQSIPPAYGARAVSAQQRATGSAHQAARRALACTWRRILSRGGKDRTLYDDATDLTALKRRGSSRLGCVQKSSKSP